MCNGFRIMHYRSDSTRLHPLPRPPVPAAPPRGRLRSRRQLHRFRRGWQG